MNANVIQNPIYKDLEKNIHPEDFEALKYILNTYEFDLAPTHGFFSEADFNQITEKAIAEYFKKILNHDLKTIDGEDLRFLWQEVVNSFSKNHWGFTKHLEKPTTYRAPRNLNLPLTPKDLVQKRPTKKISYKDSFFYIWSVLQALIITKALILVFGNELAKDDTPKNRIIFGLVISFSFGSLFLFAWMRRKKTK